jgi:O-antigen ligase
VLVRNAAIDMMEAHGLRGVGAGGFRYLFPEYLKYYPEIYKGGNLYWEHAHCDWLEIPVELGLAGDLLVLCGAGWWIAVFVRRRALWSALAVPLILGCLQTVVHAGFDFPFQCPAIMVTWCMMIAIAGRWVELELIGTSRAEG